MTHEWSGCCLLFTFLKIRKCLPINLRRFKVTHQFALWFDKDNLFSITNLFKKGKWHSLAVMAEACHFKGQRIETLPSLFFFVEVTASPFSLVTIATWTKTFGKTRWKTKKTPGLPYRRERQERRKGGSCDPVSKEEWCKKKEGRWLSPTRPIKLSTPSTVMKNVERNYPANTRVHWIQLTINNFYYIYK